MDNCGANQEATVPFEGNDGLLSAHGQVAHMGDFPNTAE